MAIVAFIPCRSGSERVPRKNIKPFADFGFGLIEIKLNQLIRCDLIEKIVLSTNDNEILDFAKSIKSYKMEIFRRDESLCSNITSTDSLIRHALDLIPSDDILWTHVTSPFINSCIYSDIIRSYFKCLEEGYDSLMTVTEIKGFVWNSSLPINYDRNIEKWPRTQTLQPLYDINSGVFLNSSNNYLRFNDRIGEKPFFYKMDKIISMDIDYPEDFMIAEILAKSNLVSL